MTALDPYADRADAGLECWKHAAVIMPSDTTDLPTVPSGFYAAQGAVKVTTQGGETLVLPDMGGQTFWNLRVTRVLATGTTPTALLAVW
jgi:hypothetical protein